jgi:putative ABC transport system substrate-binding protein
MLLTELAAKELQILKEAVPQVTRIGVLWNPKTPSHPRALKAVESAGEKLAVQSTRLRYKPQTITREHSQR